MVDWVVALLSIAAGSGTAAILVQIRKLYRERTIRRVVDWSLAAGTKDQQWADRTLGRLLGASPEPDPPVAPGKTDPPLTGPATGESTGS